MSASLSRRVHRCAGNSCRERIAFWISKSLVKESRRVSGELLFRQPAAQNVTQCYIELIGRMEFLRTTPVASAWIPPTHKKTWPLLPAQLHPSRQEHHPVCSSSVCSGGAHAARQLQEIQSSHPAMGHPGPRALQARNAKSALGRPAIGDYPPVMSFHLPGENSRIGPPFVFPHQDWLLVHFFAHFCSKESLNLG